MVLFVIKQMRIGSKSDAKFNFVITVKNSKKDFKKGLSLFLKKKKTQCIQFHIVNLLKVNFGMKFSIPLSLKIRFPIQNNNFSETYNERHLIYHFHPPLHISQ